MAHECQHEAMDLGLDLDVRAQDNANRQNQMKIGGVQICFLVGIDF